MVSLIALVATCCTAIAGQRRLASVSKKKAARTGRFWISGRLISSCAGVSRPRQEDLSQ